MNGSTLVSASNLEKNLPRRRVFDCRHDLARPDLGEQQYREGHIPGALFAHLDRDLSGRKTGKNGRHPLPDPQDFEKWLEKTGLTPKDPAVCYDAGPGAMAARLWWMLRWLGHDAAAVLDGGWNAWVKAAHPVTDQVPRIEAARFIPRPRPEAAVDVKAVAARVGKPGPLLLDARIPGRFRGENETLDPVAGHIPGAVNRPWQLNLETDGRFKTAAELRKEFGETLTGRAPERVTHYCGSGVTACHNLLAMEIAGLAGSLLYPGSWSEWVSDRSRPVAIDN